MTEIHKNCIGECAHCVQPVLASQDWTCRDGDGEEADLLDGTLFHSDCWTYGENLAPKLVGWAKPSPDPSLSNKDRREQYHDQDVAKPLDGAIELAKELSGGKRCEGDGETPGGKGDSS